MCSLVVVFVAAETGDLQDHKGKYVIGIIRVQESDHGNRKGPIRILLNTTDLSFAVYSKWIPTQIDKNASLS